MEHLLIVGISTLGSIGPIIVTYSGQGYYQKPTVIISPPNVGNGITAIAEAFLNASGGISTIRIINSGYGYTTNPTITISGGSTISSGNYIFGESVVGSVSGAVGIVKDWDGETKKLKVSGMGTDFVVGDLVVGAASSAAYRIGGYNTYSLVDAYDNSDVIEEEADDIIDFTEVNPFGEV